MASSSTAKEAETRYKFQPDDPTLSKHFKTPNDSYTIDRKNTDSSYSLRRQNDDRDTADSRRTGDSAYESMRRSSDAHSAVQRSIPPSENDRRNSHFEYTRRVPTADVFVDTMRRPAHGNARTCCMEINIAVSLGPDRTPQASIISSNLTKPPVIRSTTAFNDVSYMAIDFQSPENTAQFSTDGIALRSPSQRSTGFPNEHINE